ncbi:pseudoazurin [Neptuniibacter sp. QD72_48]|uniref:pseudoazurin n=1 Tax=unclassified Neptuniibacter TaxID=2630693 RepID=UPI0039F5E4A8
MNIKTLSAGLALAVCANFASAADHTVMMKNSGPDGSMVFEPAILNVEVGDTVTFQPTDPGHNSESISNLIPAGSTGWKGKMMKEVSFTVDKEGVYVYKCRPHAMMAMVGVVVAGKPTNLEEVKTNAAELSATFVMNKDRLTNYLNQIK